VKKKRASANKSSTDKQSNASAGNHDDSIRAAILDEATIVIILRFKLNSKENAKNNVIFSLLYLILAGLLHPQL
jgi:hypothetical protein